MLGECHRLTESLKHILQVGKHDVGPRLSSVGLSGGSEGGAGGEEESRGGEGLPTFTPTGTLRKPAVPCCGDP